MGTLMDQIEADFAAGGVMHADYGEAVTWYTVAMNAVSGTATALTVSIHRHDQIREDNSRDTIVRRATIVMGNTVTPSVRDNCTFDGYRWNVVSVTMSAPQARAWVVEVERIEQRAIASSTIRRVE